MIHAIGDECQKSAVGRPLQIVILAPIEEQSLRLALTVEGRGPHLVFLDVSELTPRGDRRRVALRDLCRRAAGHRDAPDRHQRLFGRRSRVGRKIALRRPVRVVIAATHIDQARTVGGEGQVSDLLAIVLGVLGHLLRRKVRAAGDPDVADSGDVPHPCDRIAIRSRRELAHIRVAEYFVHRELRTQGNGRDQGGEQRREILQPVQGKHSRSRMLVSSLAYYTVPIPGCVGSRPNGPAHDPDAQARVWRSRWWLN